MSATHLLPRTSVKRRCSIEIETSTRLGDRGARRRSGRRGASRSGSLLWGLPKTAVSMVDLTKTSEGNWQNFQTKHKPRRPSFDPDNCCLAAVVSRTFSGSDTAPRTPGWPIRGNQSCVGRDRVSIGTKPAGASSANSETAVSDGADARRLLVINRGLFFSLRIYAVQI